MMDYDDQMHVVDTSSGSLSASSILRLAGVDLGPLHDNMARRSRRNGWKNQTENAGDNLNDWHELAADVLMYLTMELAETDLKASIIAAPTVNVQDSLKIVMGLNSEEWEQWKSGMQTGVEKNEWVSLINHPKLSTPKVLNVAPGFPIEYQEAIIRAWNLPYYGDAHKVLLQAIDQLHIEGNYAKIIPIVQSSGTGKSKTVDEVSKTRILFPLCLREVIPDNYFAYPPADDVVRAHFLLAPATKDEVKCKQYLESFLSALFTSAYLQAQILFRGDKKVSYESIAMGFHRFFANPQNRNEFYKVVVRKAKKDPYTSVQHSLKELIDGLKDRCVKWLPTTQCPLLISMDEAHVLCNPRRGLDHGSDYTLYSHMKSVLNERVKHNLGVLTLSTAIHISSISSSKETAPSMCERDEGRTLPAPFTELPFDVYIINQPLTPDQATLDSVGSLEFTAKFGRPLFYSNYLTRKHLPNTVDNTMRIVQEKLSGRCWPPEARADVVDTSSIAVISARLLLDLSATVYTKPYEEELVRKHLRMLYSVDENRQIFVTGSSPEPLIAEASAQIMNYSLTKKGVKEPYMDLWSLLGKLVDHGLVSQGVTGQLIGRAFSISAMDHAINRLSDVCELKYQTPVSVTDYYKALLTDEAWDDLRRSMPANRARLDHQSATTTFEEAFQDAYFHFSHYAKASDSSPLGDTHGWALWLRGTAVICQVNQAVTDRMMPIYFSSRGNVSPKTISVNLEQDKTGQSVNPANVAIQSAEDLQYFLHGSKLPYIAVVHHYALTENERTSVTPPRPYDLRGQTSNDPEAPRYQIDFRGLSAYGHITDATRTLIRNMINRSKIAIFKDHSRQYGVDSLRRMLPVLSGDRASTEWFTVPGNAEQKDSVPPNKKQKTQPKHSTPGPSNAGLGSGKRK